ncbi:TetR/AcrR family transcriptional regulator [Actinacidiphila sp. ITFR-21]|uniref:TetR/AcrR family transcriptional regulator n=1 Tax=Actinacidiphila sp. ITFR-21 TaxID=3075199 RepID=UPI0028899C46|nr:TetR/AcrR family transcriptional regulator [Streptomyces sp. ITFR-21]WNI15262.1 TetR/AcrR family transcriptional regulator [Streptomyces sp. ITFR-21]
MSAAGPADGPPEPTAARRGRPRNAAVDHTVIETVLRLIAEGATLGELSMEGIAREAGVGKASVYRRWPGKDALLLDVLATVDGPPPRLESSGVLRDDLITALEFLRRRSLAKRESALLRTMVTQAQGNPELWRRYHDTVVGARRRMLIDLLEWGIAIGEIRPELGADLDLLADMVVGPVLARATLRPEAPLNPDLAERIVDTLLEGMRPRGTR